MGLVVLLGAAIGWGAPGAFASAVCYADGTDTCSVANPTSAPTTLVESYSLSNGTASDSFFSNSSYWGANVGGPPQDASGIYDTTGLTATFTQGNGKTTFGTVTLTFNTGFAASCASTCGIDNVSGNSNVYAADIFLSSGAVGTGLPAAGQTFNYAISLGYTKTPDGGMSAGLYSGTYGNSSSQDKTSTQVWGGTTGLSGYYGGAYAAASTCTTSGGATTCPTVNQSPVVATSGTAVSGINVNEQWTYSTSNPSTDALSVTLAATTAAGGLSLDSIFNNLDIFWGTGDCSNAPIFGSISGLVSVPEPSSLLLLLSGIGGVVLIRRRQRARPTVA